MIFDENEKKPIIIIYLSTDHCSGNNNNNHVVIYRFVKNRRTRSTSLGRKLICKTTHLESFSHDHLISARVGKREKKKRARQNPSAVRRLGPYVTAYLAPLVQPLLLRTVSDTIPSHVSA